MPNQTTSNIMMVSPAYFSSNNETIKTNQFQNQIDTEQSFLDIHQEAAKEYDKMVSLLKENKIEVFEFKDDIALQNTDAVFPNNWVTFHQDNRVIIYPMMSENRRNEKNNNFIKDLSLKYSFKINEVIDLSYLENDQCFLEGTGSLVLDRVNKILFACLSSRTNYEAVKILSGIIGYRCVTFEAYSRSLPIYHTNVMLSLGEKMGFICSEAILKKDLAKKVIALMDYGNRTIFEISIDQMNNFAGNVLELKNKDNEAILIMSETAKKAFTEKQLNDISSLAKIVSIPLNTIEKYGGGSARCMMAEIFLEKI